MPKYKPRRVTSQQERNSGRGNFITLKNPNDQFLGYALFAADPEQSDNPGYYEYFEHYTPATGYCPCAGDDCPLCNEGDSPNTRAKAMFLVVDSEDDDVDAGNIKIFNMNWSVVQEFFEDKDQSMGQLYRIKKGDGKGVFFIRPKTAKLTKTQLKAVMKDIEEDQLENIATRQMNRVFEEMDVASAMEDDTDDDDEVEAKAASKSRKGTPEPDDDDEDEDEAPAKAKGKSSAFDPDEDDAFDGNATVVKVNKRQNTATVTDENDVEFMLYGTDDIDVTEATKGDEFVVSASKDDDGDFVLDMWEPVEANGEPSADIEDELSDETVTIAKVNGSPEDTLIVEMEDGTEFELFFLGNGEDDNGKDWSDFDIDDYNVGDKIVISAKKDDDGDMVASTFPEKAKATRSRAKAGTAAKGRK